MLEHAFLIMVHKSPELVLRICRILEAKNHHFFIHIDEKSQEKEAIVTTLNRGGVNNLNFIKSIKVYHTRVSQIYCELSLFESALKSKVKFDYFHLISGQDYPLRSNAQFDDFFEKRNTESFMAIEGEEYHAQCMKNKKYPLRTDAYYINNKNWLIARIMDKLSPRLQLKLRIRKQLKSTWGGWNWKSLHRSTVEYMLQYINDNPNFLKRFNHTFCCDELYLPTMIHGKEKELEINGRLPLRYVSWNPTHPVESSYRPYTLDERDYKYIINSQAFFCRKVDLPKSSKLLDMIDEQRGADFNFEYCTPIL